MRFPDPVIEAMHHASLTFTCLPVQIDDGDWQVAFFYVLSPTAPCLHKGELYGGPYAVSLDADLHEHVSATVVEIGLQVETPGAPLRGAVLLLTGHSATHFDTLKLLSEQDDIPLFIGNPYCEVLWQQRVPLGDEHRKGFRSLLDESVSRDAMIRLTGRYDPDTAFAAVFSG